MSEPSPVELSKRHTFHRVTQFALLVAVILPVLLLSGCGQADQIESYTVAHEKTAEEKAAEQPKREATDRMAATIVPVGDQAWFFKLAGPRDEVMAEFQ